MFKTPFLQTACGPQPLVLPPELTSWSVPSQAPFWGCSCLVLVLLSPTYWHMYSHVFDSHTMSAWFHGAFPAPAGTTGEAAHFVHRFSLRSLLLQFTTCPQPGTWPCSGPGLRAKGQSERRPCGWGSGKATWESRAGKEFVRGCCFSFPFSYPIRSLFPKCSSASTLAFHGYFPALTSRNRIKRALRNPVWYLPIWQMGIVKSLWGRDLHRIMQLKETWWLVTCIVPESKWALWRGLWKSESSLSYLILMDRFVERWEWN